jgi:hypothetical protein
MAPGGCSTQSDPADAARALAPVGGTCNDAPCVAGARCYYEPESGDSICRRVCDSTRDCGSGGGVCMGTPGACYPEYPSDPGGAGELCNPYRPEGENCVAGTQCAVNPEDTPSGFIPRCHVLCDSDADCTRGGGSCRDWVDRDTNATIFTICEFAAPFANGMRTLGAGASPGGGTASPGDEYTGQAQCLALLASYERDRGAIACPGPAAPQGMPPALSMGDTCLRDNYVDEAANYCWAAECYLEAGGDPTTAAQAAIAGLMKANALCSNAPVLGTPMECKTSRLYACP